VSTVIHMHQAKAAKADGVFAAVNIAARRMGYSESMAFRVARQAKAQFKIGHRSAAKVVSDVKASLRTDSEGLQA
jgi:hypothetical protein